MELKELHKSIMDKKNLHLYIFTGSEIYVRDTYIKQIARIFDCGDTVRYDTVSEAVRAIKKPRLSSGRICFVVSDDKLYLKDDKSWKTVNNAVIQYDTILIIVYNNLDKRSKFYKQYKDTICEFDVLPDNILKSYILADLPDFSENCVKKLISMCESNYNRIRLEEDKIRHFTEYHNVSFDEAFNELVAAGIIAAPIGDITFKFTDAILLHDIGAIKKYSVQAKQIGEPELLTLGTLYNGFKNILSVQTAPKNIKAADLGLTPFQYKLAKEKSNVYTNADVIFMLKLITKIEQGIKNGTIMPEIAIDYLLVNIL